MIMKWKEVLYPIFLVLSPKKAGGTAGNHRNLLKTVGVQTETQTLDLQNTGGVLRMGLTVTTVYKFMKWSF